MDEKRDTDRTETEETASTSHTSAWLIAAVVALIVGVGMAVGHTYRQPRASNQAVSHEAEMSATINQMQGQIDSLNAKLNQVTIAPPATPTNGARPAVDPTAAKRRTAAENKHFKQIQSQLTDQQQQLKDTQDQLAQARTDLEGSLNSTRDDLNGSIARTHEELVALEQKGERKYVEFDLVKAKHFLPAGGVALSLRKTDPKHKTYDLAMVVNDDQISKKHVNLYEPIWIEDTDSQQVQVVVNKIDKDHVHGYMSAPKYSQSARLVPAASQTSNGASTEPVTNQSTPSSSDSRSTTTQLPQ
jgi:hypothetical protein